ncbi:MAG: NAD(P)-dependent oxidoreductase [Limisphaerales bacterium]
MLRIGILEPERYPARALDILQPFGEVSRRSESAPLQAFMANVEVLIIRLQHLIDRDFLAQAPRLKVISTATTGLDHIDLKAAEERTITVLSLRGETDFLRSVTATAEHTWGLLLALLRHIPQAHQAVVSGDWNRNNFFGRELQGRTLAIVGLGRIGQMVARYGLAFQMRVIAYDPFQNEWIEGVEQMHDLTELLLSADVLSIHVPLSDKTKHLVSVKEFAALKQRAIVLNTSRGAILDEAVLLENLENGRLAGAALDVIHDEYSPSSGLRERTIRYAATHDNLLLTPHLGGATHDSLEKVEVFMAEKLARYLQSLR